MPTSVYERTASTCTTLCQRHALLCRNRMSAVQYNAMFCINLNRCRFRLKSCVENDKNKIINVIDFLKNIPASVSNTNEHLLNCMHFAEYRYHLTKFCNMSKLTALVVNYVYFFHNRSYKNAYIVITCVCLFMCWYDVSVKPPHRMNLVRPKRRTSTDRCCWTRHGTWSS